MSAPSGIAIWQSWVHGLSASKGWWDGIAPKDPKVIPEKLCLIHSEVSEALEIYRDFGKDDGLEQLGYKLEEPVYLSHDETDVTSHRFTAYLDDGNTEDKSKPGKPVGLDSELADVVIRVMDLCEHLGIDLERAIREKHEYNATRARRHGGKAC